MNLTGMRIGIWGFGVVGKSVASFVSKQGAAVTIIDKRILPTEESAFIESINASYLMQTEETIFQLFKNNEKVIPSAGIDLRPFASLLDTEKILTELDLFFSFFKKPIIAITGTVGKTTVTTVITQALISAQYNVQSAGNIGIGLCDLIDTQETLDYIVLEVSSFQLEHSRIFTPDLAIITNIYPNHLDRHATMEEYADAKLSMVYRQKTHQKALFHETVFAYIKKPIAAKIYSFSGAAMGNNCFISSIHFYCDDSYVRAQTSRANEKVMSCVGLERTIMKENLISAVGALSILSIAPQPSFFVFSGIEHRMEFVRAVRHITFINDSKSTIVESTIAAVHACKVKPVLLLGGLSKGVDRLRLIGQLQHVVAWFVCFGKESELLYSFCIQYSISFSSCCLTLEDAFSEALARVESNAESIVLLSPSGSSYDFFSDYKERGKRFKQLVYAYEDRCSQEKVSAAALLSQS